MRSARNRNKTATVTKKQVTTGCARYFKLRQKVFRKILTNRLDLDNKLRQITMNWNMCPLFGKDEVTSSNLVSSSKISLKLVGFGEIFLVLVTFLVS